MSGTAIATWFSTPNLHTGEFWRVRDELGLVCDSGFEEDKDVRDRRLSRIGGYLGELRWGRRVGRGENGLSERRT